MKNKTDSVVSPAMREWLGGAVATNNESRINNPL